MWSQWVWPISRWPSTAAAVSHELLAQLVDPGAAVEDEQRAAVGAHRHARRVAAVPDRRGARLGDRATRTPEGDLHERLQRRSSREPYAVSGACGRGDGIRLVAGPRTR